MNRFFNKILAAGAFSSALLLGGCSGPAAPAAQTQAKAADSDDSVPVRQEQRPATRATPAPERQTSAPEAAARPKPVAREVSRPLTPSAPAKPVNTVSPAPASAPKPAAAETPVATSASNSPAPGTLTLPAPAAPAIDTPVPPPQEVKPEPEPPRQVRVPSGTLVSIRMIDAVDSSTAHAGETFKASLDQPIAVNNDTVFPRGSEVYVKLARVESAGRVRGQSELVLQLDRIFLGKQGYLLDTSSYTTTGASQGTKTAKTAGLGAALGAAIGAIAGGGKGAAIGAATGAGAGAGAEAIRKGEQVRVDSESRLDFRLESPIDVTIPSPSNNQPRNNPSVPLRFGTRQ
jgi:hypothetical protein